MDSRYCFLLGLLCLLLATLSEVECQGPPKPFIPPQPRITCAFDTGNCGFKILKALPIIPGLPNYKPAWAVGNGPHLPDTGPSKDHTSGTGKYVYIKAAAKDKATAKFSSPATMGDVCVSFYYTMNGPTPSSVGHLKVFRKPEGAPPGLRVKTPSFEISGSQGKAWKRASFTICVTDAKRYLLEFEGRVASNLGDIAIDDVTIGFCSEAACTCQGICPAIKPPPTKMPVITPAPTTQSTVPPTTTQATTPAPTQPPTTKTQGSNTTPKGSVTPKPVTAAPIASTPKTPLGTGGPSITIDVISATGSGMSKGTQAAIGIGSFIAGLAILSLIFSSRRIMTKVQETQGNEVKPIIPQDNKF